MEQEAGECLKTHICISRVERVNQVPVEMELDTGAFQIGTLIKLFQIFSKAKDIRG